MTNVLIRKESLDTDRHIGKTPCEHENGHPLATESSLKEIPIHSLQKESSLPMLYFQSPGLQIWETIHFCCLSHSACGPTKLVPSVSNRGWLPKSQALDPRSHQIVQVPLAHLTHVTLFPGQALLLTDPIFLCLSVLPTARHSWGSVPSCSWWPVPHSLCLPDLAWFGYIPAWILGLGFFPACCCSSSWVSFTVASSPLCSRAPCRESCRLGTWEELSWRTGGHSHLPHAAFHHS